jgi:putative methanogenesis marker protein 7
MFEVAMFRGGAYKHNKLVELIEDVGGYILESRKVAQEINLRFAVPFEDWEYIQAFVVEELDGSLKILPLLMCEVAVVSPTISRHHLPHSVCDIAEFYRRRGAFTNVIGLSTGRGKIRTGLTDEEIKIINEHELAVIVLGNFRTCIEEKVNIFDEIRIPKIFVGAPKTINVDVSYLGGIGRKGHRFSTMHEIQLLEALIEKSSMLIKELKKELELNPPVYPVFYVIDQIKKNIEDLQYTIAPTPLVPKLNGCRVNLPYGHYNSALREIEVGEHKLKEISNMQKSYFNDSILIRLKPRYLLEV